MLGRLTEAVDFNDLLKCETWKMEDSTINLPMNVTDDSEGAYKCEEDENTLLLLVYGKNGPPCIELQMWQLGLCIW